MEEDAGEEAEADVDGGVLEGVDPLEMGGMVRGNNEKLPGMALDHCIAVWRKMARSQWPPPTAF